MRVSKNEIICGLPAPMARQLMRAYFDYRSPGLAADLLDMDLDAAEDQLRSFEAAGYLKQVGKESAVGDQRWVTTVQGNALAQASFGKPIGRATAERHLAQVIERASDLAVTIVRRETDGQRYVDHVLDYARASGRRFGVFIEQLMWPARELILILKNRSPVISITNEDISKLTRMFKIVYMVQDDPFAIQPPQNASIER